MMLNYIRWLFFPKKIVFRKEQTKIDTFRVPFWEQLVLVSDQNRIKEINKLMGKVYMGGAGNEFLVPLFGNQSVFTLDGAGHRTSRRLISPSLKRSVMHSSQSAVVELIAKHLSKVGLGASINVGHFCRKITMELMCKMILDVEDPKTVEKMFNSFEGTTGYLANIVSYNKLFWKDGPMLPGRIVSKRVAEIDKIIFELMERDLKDLNPECTLASLKSHQREYNYDNVFIRDNLVATIAAGYDTLASAMTWMLFWVSYHGGFGDFPDIEDTGYEKYLDNFIRESLRFCPPIEILPRRPISTENTSDKEISNDDLSGTMVCPCPHLVHHDSEIFDSPEVFDPGRFLAKKHSATEYFPFGLASRLCLGVNIAPEIMKLVLKELHSKNLYFKFRVKTFKPIRRNVSLWPSFMTKAVLSTYKSKCH